MTRSVAKNPRIAKQCNGNIHSLSRVASLVFSEASKLLVKWSPCCIHRPVLASKTLLTSMKDDLDDSVKVINFIRGERNSSTGFKGCSHLFVTRRAEGAAARQIYRC
ncbi:hypothetical protein TNCV_877351 [Trichonephila clavipes]|nr:hypothetical protein TNCV_877351 [Trichonephila clavipes]